MRARQRCGPVLLCVTLSAAGGSDLQCLSCELDVGKGTGKQGGEIGIVVALQVKEWGGRGGLEWVGESEGGKDSCR